MTASVRMLAIASGKGGVGKTFAAITLAQAYTSSGLKTLLVDGDFGLANADVQMGLQPRGHLLDVVRGQMTLEAAVTPAPCGMDVIAGASGTGALSGLAHGEVLAIATSLKLIAARYDRVVVDLGAGIEPGLLSLAEASGRLLVLLSDEPTSLTDAYALIKLARRRSAPPALNIAVNNAESPASAQSAYDALAKACGAFLGFTPPLAGIIPRDSQVRSAIKAQTPYLTLFPAGPAGAALRRIAQTLDAQAAEPAPPRTATKLR